jgi:signal transduction histidine kinase
MKKRLVYIGIAFLVSFIAMVMLSLYSMERFANLTTYSQLVTHSHQVIDKLYRTDGFLKDMDRAERGYILTRDTMYKRFVNNSIDSLMPTLNSLQDLVKDNPAQQNNLALVKGNVALRVGYARRNMEFADSARSSDPSSYYFDGRKTMLENSRKMREMHQIENKLMADRFEKQQFYQKLTTNTLRSLLFIFCVITLILFAIMIKEFRSRISFQEELQAKVIDLKRSHNELQEIAYAASHDLQEPLRKIQVFSNMMLYQKNDNLTSENKETLRRISSSANRMQLLITDLRNLTSLTNTEEAKTTTDMNRMLQYLLIDIDERVRERAATITVQQLPVINGYDNQLKILFSALLDNALKFVRDGVAPIITVSCERMNGHELSDINPNLLHKRFYRISFSDNGIGFDNKFISKIFMIFQRLHNQQSDYEGKGIGLAVCQRIMANHEGYIIAHGEPGMGATFKLFFPENG